MQKYQNVIIDSTGNAIPSVTVNVYNAGTLVRPTIYSDNGSTPRANPFQSAADGGIVFYAANGRYDIVLSKTGYTFGTDLYDTQLFDDTADPVVFADKVTVTDVLTTSAGITVTTGGLTVTAGGETITAGNLTITAGKIVMGATASKLVPGATSFSIRNNADGVDNFLLNDAGLATIAAGLVVTAGGIGVTLGNVTLTAGNLVLTLGDITITNGKITQVYTNASATPSSVRAAYTKVNSGVGLTGGNLVAIRGEMNLSDFITNTFVYGVQGKLITNTTTITGGSAHICGVLAQVDYSGSTLSSGHIACLICSVQNTGTPISTSVFDGIYMEMPAYGSGMQVNSYIRMFGSVAYAFDFQTAGTIIADGGATPGTTKKKIKINVEGVGPMYLLAADDWA